MVVLAFLVPLFILVSDLAHDRAISAAERDAESLARVLSVLTVNNDLQTAVGTVGENRIRSVNGSVIFPDGTVVGLSVPPDEDLTLALDGSSFIAAVDGGKAVYIPVIQPDGSTFVVRAFAADEAITSGVKRSWLVLALLGIALVVMAAWVADRLGRSMVVPIKDLSATAGRLGHGDLSVRVQPAGPPEIEEVGLELNRLADRIGRLLQAERESAADLAHRLRTPLTAARLSVDGLAESPEKDRLNTDLDELQRTTDFVIREARRPVRRESEAWCDVDGADAAAPVAIPDGDAEAMIDALIENVLAHTPEGTPFLVHVDIGSDIVLLSIEDAGSGFSDGSVIDRGTSSADSTGLGLDIVRRTVEGAGGTLAIGESLTHSGAGIVIRLPLTSEQ